MIQLNAIKQMETYARYHPEVVSLSQGIPFLQSDVSIRYGAIEALLTNNVDTYADPRGLLALRRKIAALLSEEHMEYDKDEILITAGATEGLSVALMSLLTPEKDEVIVPTPTYSAYFRIISIAKGEPVALSLDEEKGWELDPELLKKKITKHTRAILLCNPNNPTGSIYSRETLDKICTLAKQHKITVILDEVYKNMIFDDIAFYTPCVDPQFREIIIRAVSFSKDFSLTGWRIGFLHTDRARIEKILPIHDAFINCVPVISQYAGLAALANQERIFQDNKKIYTKQRTMMKDYLDELSDILTYTLPQGAYFFFPRFLKKRDVVSFCFDLLQKEQVAVVPGSDFGLGGEDHIRLCFGRHPEDIRRGMERLKRFLKKETI